MTSLTDLMDDFFATHAYNEQGDWRKEPLTDIDPDEESAPKKALPVIRLEQDHDA